MAGIHLFSLLPASFPFLFLGSFFSVHTHTDCSASGPWGEIPWIWQKVYWRKITYATIKAAKSTTWQLLPLQHSFSQKNITEMSQPIMCGYWVQPCSLTTSITGNNILQVNRWETFLQPNELLSVKVMVIRVIHASCSSSWAFVACVSLSSITMLHSSRSELSLMPSLSDLLKSNIKKWNFIHPTHAQFPHFLIKFFSQSLTVTLDTNTFLLLWSFY